MALFNKASLLADLAKRNEAVSREVAEILAGLSDADLNWKPEPQSWSIAQVADHLVKTHQSYLLTIEEKLASSPVDNSDSYRSSWLGERFITYINPRADGTIKRIKAPAFLHPGSSIDSDSVLKQYFEQQQLLTQQIARGRSVNLRSVKIPLSVSKLLKLPLGDVWRFITAHNERHLLQMQKIKKPLQVQMEKQRFV